MIPSRTGTLQSRCSSLGKSVQHCANGFEAHAYSSSFEDRTRSQFVNGKHTPSSGFKIVRVLDFILFER